ncbi:MULTISPECIES: uridylate kinase [unclassified Micromonospora]|uniref:uridylate kinase n=1 Tax=unclassified Micromonospora TaxID=2617518 RepID=UPI001B35D49F|nr:MULTISPECIES: uridylate kinase [unclassified Micromonospora]MBQ1042963.1 uridylate kinase [Micromonospora sp. C72]MBQ1056611.1 uridylate kinase [Micromonospora sp. C32]
MSGRRAQVLARLADDLAVRRPPHPLRVAVDGPDAAGKTRLADDLAEVLGARRSVLRVSVDGFHRPAAVRRARGPLSPDGYYRDAFDHETLVARVLRPLGPGGDRRYLPAAYDLRAEAPVTAEPVTAPSDAVLLADGVFLLRPELRAHWDVTVYLHVEPAETLRRALIRDLGVFGSAEEVRRRYRARYLPGQELYRAEANPARQADVVLDLADPLAPVVLTWRR